MEKLRENLFLIGILVLAILFPGISKAQEGRYKSQEMSEKEGIPVLIKHLPDWESKRESAIFVTTKKDLQAYLDQRAVVDRVDFIPGTEAVIASYPEGKLLLIEFATPQASVDADEKILSFIDQNGQSGFFYRRIGNYNAFIFDGTDEAAANALLDQIKYEKVVQWLGSEPFTPLMGGETERDFIRGASSLFISTMIVIVAGIAASSVIGVIAGLVYFFLGEQRRSSMTAFSDAGGMTRLNLDGLSAELPPVKLLNK